MALPIDGLKLFRVEITHTLYLLAPNEIVAADDGPSYIRDEGSEPEVHVIEQRSIDGLSDDVRGSLPHHDIYPNPYRDDPPTVEECVAAIASRDR